MVLSLQDARHNTCWAEGVVCNLFPPKFHNSVQHGSLEKSKGLPNMHSNIHFPSSTLLFLTQRSHICLQAVSYMVWLRYTTTSSLHQLERYWLVNIMVESAPPPPATAGSVTQENVSYDAATPPRPILSSTINVSFTASV